MANDIQPDWDAAMAVLCTEEADKEAAREEIEKGIQHARLYLNRAFSDGPLEGEPGVTVFHMRNP